MSDMMRGVQGVDVEQYREAMMSDVDVDADGLALIGTRLRKPNTPWQGVITGKRKLEELCLHVSRTVAGHRWEKQEETSLYIGQAEGRCRDPSAPQRESIGT